MGEQRQRRIRRTIGATLALGALVAGVAIAAGGVRATAAGIPIKNCADQTRPGATSAVGGDTLQCTISIDLAVASGEKFTVQPTSPNIAYIPVGGCNGASGGIGPFAYTVAATNNGQLGTPAGTCTFTVSGTISPGANVIGTELVFIPPATPANTPVTQQIIQCLAPTACLPATPMGVSGVTCVNGVSFPVIGCEPAALTSPTPSPTVNATATASETPTGAVAGISNSNPDTSGPEHPLPIAAAGVVLAGVLLATGAAFGPALLRRRRASLAVRRDR